MTDLHEQIARTATEWALMYPLANYGFWSCADGAAEMSLNVIADTIAKAWGRDIADRVLAVLPGDLEDLHAQVAESKAQREIARLQGEWDRLNDARIDESNRAHEAEAQVAALQAELAEAREAIECALNFPHTNRTVRMLRAALPSRPDDPEEIRRLAESAED